MQSSGAFRHLVPMRFTSREIDEHEAILSYPERTVGGFATIETRQVDHWFAYTDLSRRIVEGFGHPAEKITDVNNAIDSGGPH
jgi:hypothetical protein